MTQKKLIIFYLQLIIFFTPFYMIQLSAPSYLFQVTNYDRLWSLGFFFVCSPLTSIAHNVKGKPFVPHHTHTHTKRSFRPDCPAPGSFSPFLSRCRPICARIHMVMRVRRWGGSHVQCATRAFVLEPPPPRPEVKLNSAQIPQRVWPWGWTRVDRGASCGPLWSWAFRVIEDPDY